jgi:peptidoglycan hydrolase-like protein with peptidoglycan-binding domain
MAIGYLRIFATYENATLPIPGASVRVYSKEPAELIYQTTTNAEGQTEYMSLTAPEVAQTFDSSQLSPAYSLYDVEVSLDGFNTTYIHDVEILPEVSSTLTVELLPATRDGRAVRTEMVIHRHLHPEDDDNTVDTDDPLNDIEITPNALLLPEQSSRVGADAGGVKDVYIPRNITVHLGAPTNSSARNVTVPFAEYIANVASSEIYATWPEEALYANMYAITTFAINRIYTEWYRGRGYNFDITNNTAYDQYFVYGRNMFDNLQQIADEIFDIYVRKIGFKNPYFTQYCNGTTTTCNGLSQWGTVTQANQGKNALQILQYYYGNDVELVESDNVQNVQETYPGTVMRQGDSNNYIKLIQQYLNRIRLNYPAIPAIADANGYYGADTSAAVNAFQNVFGLTKDGAIGRSTWNKISQTYFAIVKLAELNGEGERIGIGTTPPTSTISQGSTGNNVRLLQYILNYLAEFYSTIPSQIEDGKFGSGTANTVKEFQRNFGLTADGVVGAATWRRLYDTYNSVKGNITVPMPPESEGQQPYPNTVLTTGSRGNSVTYIQNALNKISESYPKIPKLSADGVYGASTANAVRIFQEQFGLEADGITGAITWNAINSTLTAIGTDSGSAKPSYPGTPLRYGSRGSNVTYIQQVLQRLSARYSAIPNPGSADGIFGSATEASVRALQRYFGLTQDGIVGSATWNALNNA